MSKDDLSLFASVLGPGFNDLPLAVQQSHTFTDSLTLAGTSSVTRGTALWPRFLARLFRFPRASDQTSVSVTKERIGNKEVWTRDFDGQRFTSTLTATPQGMTERFGPITFTIDLHVKDDALHYPVKTARVGPIPLPAWLLPISIAREYATNDTFHFDVALYAPLTRQLMVRYQGMLRPA